MKLTQFLEKAKMTLKHAGKVTVILIAMVAGFATSEIYQVYKSQSEISKLPKTKTQKETSIAINESGEVMIIDRSTGVYEIYNDSVGKMFFDLYASQMMYTITKSASASSSTSKTTKK